METSSFLLIEDMARLERACLATIADVKKTREEALEIAIEREMNLPELVSPKRSWFESWFSKPKENNYFQKNGPAKTREEALSRLKQYTFGSLRSQYSRIMTCYHQQYSAAECFLEIARSGTRIVHMTANDFFYISQEYNKT